MSDVSESAKAGYREGTVSVIGNTVLFALKMWAGIVSGSLALVADAWHTLSDCASSLVVIVAERLSVRKADREHPFGHGRWELIAALFIGFMLAAVACTFVVDALEKLEERESADFGRLAIVVTVISIVVKELMAQYAFRLAKRTGNVSVKADGWHHRSDALSSVVVLVGICFADRFWWIDAALGIAVALMLLVVAYQIARESVEKLLGEKPSDELVKQIVDEVEKLYDGNLKMHHFHIHNYVTQKELIFHIKLPGEMTIREGHSIATKIEGRIHEKFNINATVHVEPLNSEKKDN